MLLVPSWLFVRAKTACEDHQTAAGLLEQAQQQENLLLLLLAGKTEANESERQRLQLLDEQLHGHKSDPGPH